MKNKKFYIFASNQQNAGPRTIADQVLKSAKRFLCKKFELIHLCSPQTKNICINVKKFNVVKKSSLFERFKFEVFSAKKLLKIKKNDYFLSLQDFPTKIVCKNHYIYVHNALPFSKLKLTDYCFEPFLLIYKALYSVCYCLLAHSSSRKIVQTKLMRKNLLKIKNNQDIIIVRPFLRRRNNCIPKKSKNILFFPARPRPFKQIELACEAVISFNKKFTNSTQLIITLLGNENLYSRYLHFLYGKEASILFFGPLSARECNELYKTCKGLIFTSRVETWGLPISEAMEWNLPVIVPDLPYAREVVGKYRNSYFCDPKHPATWTQAISRVIDSPNASKWPSTHFKDNQLTWEKFFKNIN